MKTTERRSAFTLIEVLIAMIIIGVLATFGMAFHVISAAL